LGSFEEDLCSTVDAILEALSSEPTIGGVQQSTTVAWRDGGEPSQAAAANMMRPTDNRANLLI